MKNMFKKIVGIVLTITMLASLMSFAAFADTTDAPFSGSGTEEDPYLISTSDDLVKLAELTNVANSAYSSKYYKLTADIDMKGVEFDGICEKEYTDTNGALAWNNYNSFSGTIDGDNHVISNMTIDRSDNTSNSNTYGGLVCWTSSSALIKNLGLVNTTVIAYNGAGGFVGRGAANLTNCFVRTITLKASADYRGAFAGHIRANSVISDCYSRDITGTNMSDVNDDVLGTGQRYVTTYTQSLTNVYSDTFIGNSSTENLTMTNSFRFSSTSDANITNFLTTSSGVFEADTFSQNDGYPVLAWENDFLSGGRGTEDNPYLISTPEDLVELSELTKASTSTNPFLAADKYYKLTNDIDMNFRDDFYGIATRESETTTDGVTTYGLAVSTTDYSFKGTIDGDGHVISNLKVDRSRNTAANAYAALVVWVSGATIKNLGIYNINMTTGNSSSGRYVSGFVGSGKASIENCFLKGTETLASGKTGSSIERKAAFNSNYGNNSVIKNCYSRINDFSIASKGSSSTNAIIYTNVYWSANAASMPTGSTNVLSIQSAGRYWADSSGYTATNAPLTTAKGAFLTAAGDAFELDIFNQNGGYPVLAWENGFYITFDDANNLRVANRTGAPVTGKLLIASYEANDKMLAPVYLNDISLKAWKDTEYADSIIPYTPVEGATLYKAFVWSDLTDLTPLCIAARYPEE